MEHGSKSAASTAQGSTAQGSTGHKGFAASQKMFDRALAIMPGGVNSPVRAFGAVGGQPVFISRAEGPYLFDEDGNRYVDYVGSFGPAIVGHAEPQVVAAVQQAALRGFSYGAPTNLETQLAERVRAAMPSMEKVRLVSSGTEACMAAVRVARAFTGRSRLIKFTGCYHGHADMFLVKAGSGALTLGLPDSPGVPAAVTADTMLCNYNDLDGLTQIFKAYGNELAAVIVEPLVGNAGFIRPKPGFLEAMVSLCEQHGALAIFDEVMTGFRVGWGGMQGKLGLRPHLTTIGKVIGGGMPLAAYGGRRDIMARVAPEGPVYQAGTLSGNPLAVSCGLATLDVLGGPESFKVLESKAKQLCDGLQLAAKEANIPLQTDYEGGMFGMFFAAKPVASFEEAKEADVGRFKRFFQGMLAEGVYFAPSAFEAGFISLAHSNTDIEATIAAARSVMLAIR